MKVLHPSPFTPLSVLYKPKNFPSSSSSSFASPPKAPSAFNKIPPAALHGGIVLLSSVFPTTLAKALSYDEALQQTTTSFSSDGVLDSVVNFISDNPTVVAGGAVALAVPLILSQVLKGSKPWGIETARSAYGKLGEDPNAQLLDIRGPKEFKDVGSPDIKGFGKKPVSIAFNGEDKLGFLKKLDLKFKEPENTTLFIIDKFNGNSELVAELVTVNGFKAAYAIKDGAEGPQGWMNSGLPWIPPKKGLELSNLTETLSGAFGDESGGLSVTLGIAAATGLGLLAFSEIETILQVLGTAAIIQLLSKKLLFAEDRKKTLQQVDEFLSTKVAPKELVDDIKQIGVALIPTTTTSKALPAPTEANPEPKSEVSAEPPPQINAVPESESKPKGSSGTPRPLSPYPSYPDFKPPTSPTPSQP
ncbi:rhodanese-like domain-containing protein 4, chloroplastic [Gossypium australe]|uniref:Rhodanese-like domain-containing protein 4, chloroplastic n=1 Tax=Gossypium australe TaxID=47621 RepID=A0A5B6UXW8_9ROSI|nr:rhodanese-like domain-containing protein 4, chloroplastic [Gossypium australe]